MSRQKLTVVLSQAQGKDPRKRALEESLAAALIMESGLDVSIVPYLYDLDATHTGRLFLESVSGDLDLRDIVTRQVRTHTVSGDVSFVGAILDAGRYEFTTHSGEIALSLPGDTGAELSVSTFSGGIESDFPITLKAGEHGIGAAQAKRLTFTVGRGTARIVAETFSGDITLKRRR